MSRIIVVACILLTSLLLFTNLPSCRKDEYEEVTIDLYSLILPGATDTLHEVVAKFAWQGGGYLRQISRVKVDHYSNCIMIQPFGLQYLDGPCCMDFFVRIDTVSLGILAGGAYNIVLIGRNYVYTDVIHVPIQAANTTFQFQISAIDMRTHQPASNIPIHAQIDDSAFTHLTDTTDMSGTTVLEYENNAVDTIAYDLGTGPNGWSRYYGNTRATRGIPEVITLGIGE